jgi:hypothetical protein
LGAEEVSDETDVRRLPFWLTLIEIYGVYFPRRFPGYLDNSVAGGIPSGMPIFTSLVKESMEEACIPEDTIRNNAKGCGAISYFFQ